MEYKVIEKSAGKDINGMYLILTLESIEEQFEFQVTVLSPITIERIKKEISRKFKTERRKNATLDIVQIGEIIEI